MSASETRTPLIAAALIGLALALVLMWPRFGGQRDAPDTAAAPPRSSGPSSVATEASASPEVVPSVSRPARVAADPEPDAGEGPCPRNMVYVEGRYCPYVAHRCAAFIGADPIPSRGDRSRRRRDEDVQRRCERYRDELICEGRPADLKYCIDLYEYPNIAGAKPAIMVDYHQAKRACRIEGKRLCEAEEWIYACEGPRTLPYPTGLVRDLGACNIDRRPRRPNLRALDTPHDVSVEIERLDQRMPAGALEACVSPFGAFDLSGNVAEWVHNREANPDEGISVTAIAGGHSGRVPATCRLLDTDQRASHRDHQTGFRCCRDALDGRPARRLMPKGFRLPKRRKLTE